MKTIYIDLNEEITTIVGKIENVRSHNVVLVVPKKAQLFQSIINLKILLSKVQTLGKKLEIYTNDPKGKEICKKNNIDLYEGSITTIGKTKPIRVEGGMVKQKSLNGEKKVSLTELINSEHRRAKMETLLSKPQTQKQHQEKMKWTQLLFFSTLRKKTTFVFLSASIGLLFLVSYIALPSATVYITPDSNVVEKTINITLADRQKRADLLRQTGRNIIPSFTIETVFEQNLTYATQGKVFIGNNAECELTILNTRGSTWELIEQTRLQSPEGIIFRLPKGIQVPAASYESVPNAQGSNTRERVPGRVTLRLTADELDANGEIAGAGGNLQEGVTFTFPALSAENQELISAKNFKPCSGGLTASYAIVTESDIEAAKKKMEQLLSKGAKDYLLEHIEALNLENHTNLVLFDDPQLIREQIVEINLPLSALGQKTEALVVNGKMKVNGVAYNEEDYFSILDEELLKKVHPSKRLASIDRNSTTHSIVYSDSDIADLSRVKLSVTVKGIEEYNFDPESPEGRAVLDKILSAIPGKTKSDAEFFISNMEEIRKTRIAVWPFWQDTIPGLKSSVSIKIN